MLLYLMLVQCCCYSDLFLTSGAPWQAKFVGDYLPWRWTPVDGWCGSWGYQSLHRTFWCVNCLLLCVWYGMVLFSVVLCYVVLCGVVLCGVMLCHCVMIWFGVMWLDVWCFCAWVCAVLFCPYSIRISWLSFYFSHSILLLLSQGPEVPFPGNVFITHNHLDHAGELPMLFVIESKRRYKAGQPKLRLLCGPEVTDRLKIHRLHEMLSLFKPVLYSALCAVLCRAVPCRAVPCRALLCVTLRCRAVPCRAVLSYAILFCARNKVKRRILNIYKL